MEPQEPSKSEKWNEWNCILERGQELVVCRKYGVLRCARNLRLSFAINRVRGDGYLNQAAGEIGQLERM